jgi:hypothetical protein
VAFGNLTAFLEKVGLKFSADEIQRHRDVRDAAGFGLPFGEGNLAVVVLRTLMEAQRRHDLMLPPGVVERDDGIHSAAQEHDGFHR